MVLESANKEAYISPNKVRRRMFCCCQSGAIGFVAVLSLPPTLQLVVCNLLFIGIEFNVKGWGFQSLASLLLALLLSCEYNTVSLSCSHSFIILLGHVRFHYNTSKLNTYKFRP